MKRLEDRRASHRLDESEDEIAGGGYKRSHASRSPPGSNVTWTRVREEVKRMEDVLTKKIGNAVEKLGTLMKKYVKE